jgi:hypothetical protein
MVDTVLGPEGLQNEAVLVSEATAFCASESLLLASQSKDLVYTHAPFSLLPNDFPASQYVKALQISTLFNLLVGRDRILFLCVQVRGSDRLSSPGINVAEGGASRG